MRPSPTIVSSVAIEPVRAGAVWFSWLLAFALGFSGCSSFGQSASAESKPRGGDARFSDLGSLPLPLTPPAGPPDLKERAEYYLGLLGEDLRLGKLDRIGAWAAELRSNERTRSEVLALESIFLSANSRFPEAKSQVELAEQHAPISRLIPGAKAMVSRGEGKLAEALEFAQRGVEQDPSHPYLWNVLGRVQADRGDVSSALASFQRAVDLEPRFAPGHKNIGALELVRGDGRKAGEAYAKALELNGADWEARHGGALAKEAMGDLRGAMEELKAGLRVVPNSAVMLHKLAVWQAAAGLLDESVQTSRMLATNGVVSGHLLAADGLMQKGDWTEASRHIEQAGLQDPNRHYLNAFVLMARGRYPDALGSLNRVLELDKNHYGASVASVVLRFFSQKPLEAHVPLPNRWSPDLGGFLAFIDGCVLGSQGDWRKASERFQAAEGFIPGFSAAGLDLEALARPSHAEELRRTALAVLFYLKNLPRPALEILQPLISRDRRAPLAHYWAGAAQLKLRDRRKALAHFLAGARAAPRFHAALYAAAEIHASGGESDKAAQLYRRASEVKEDPGLFLRLGVFYEQKKEFEAAEKEYRGLIKSAPDLFLGYNQLAWLLVRQEKNLEEAHQLASKADSLQPGNASVLDTLGWIEFKRKRYEPALVALQAAAEVNPSNPTIWLHLGAVFETLNKKQDAIKALNRAIELAGAAGNSEAAEEARNRLRRVQDSKP